MLILTKLGTLLEKLYEKWTENCNNVILFTWLDFLKTEAIKALDIKFPIVVSVEQILKLTEESILRLFLLVIWLVISTSIGLFSIALSFLQQLLNLFFVIFRGEEIFSRGCHYCPVCLLMKPGTECVCLSICEHILCKDCLSGYLTISIQEGNIHAIRCPCEECDEEIYPNIVSTNLCSLQKHYFSFHNLCGLNESIRHWFHMQY